MNCNTDIIQDSNWRLYFPTNVRPNNFRDKGPILFWKTVFPNGWTHRSSAVSIKIFDAPEVSSSIRLISSQAALPSNSPSNWRCKIFLVRQLERWKRAGIGAPLVFKSLGCHSTLGLCPWAHFFFQSFSCFYDQAGFYGRGHFFGSCWFFFQVSQSGVDQCAYLCQSGCRLCPLFRCRASLTILLILTIGPVATKRQAMGCFSASGLRKSGDKPERWISLSICDQQFRSAPCIQFYARPVQALIIWMKTKWLQFVVIKREMF